MSQLVTNGDMLATPLFGMVNQRDKSQTENVLPRCRTGRGSSRTRCSLTWVLILGYSRSIKCVHSGQSSINRKRKSEPVGKRTAHTWPWWRCRPVHWSQRIMVATA